MQHEVFERDVLWIQQCAQRKALVGAVKKCKEVIDVLFFIHSYLLYFYLLSLIILLWFYFCYIYFCDFTIMYCLFHWFIENWTVLFVPYWRQRCKWDVIFVVNFLITSIWYCPWMYFNICFKYFTVSLTGFILLGR